MKTSTSCLRWFLALAVAAMAFFRTPSAQAQLVNSSVRVQVGTGANILIAGFAVGSTPKTFLIRAGGPALTQFGLTGVLNDPQIRVFNAQSQEIATNNDWSTGAQAGAITQAALSVGAFAFPNGSRDAAVIVTLQSGTYTAQISGADGGSGLAIFEAYEIATTFAQTSTLRGIVRDGATRSGLSGVNLSFANSSGATLGSVQTSSTGEYSINIPAGAVVATITFSGYVSTTLSTTLPANSTVQADAVLFARNQPGNGTMTGRITNALTGQGLAGASLQFRSGVGATTGTVVGTTSTDASGNFSMALPSGTYTATVSMTGFVTSSFACVAVGGSTIANQNSSITPNLTGSDIRIVLTWGASPSDLDSHLTGPIAGSSSRFHVYWANPRVTQANLDVDDTSSFGPETITIAQISAGTFRYSVHDYSNGSSSTSTVMSNSSGAQVRVFSGSTQIATFNVPTGRTGNLWTVFEMDGNSRAITSINSISNVSSDSAVQSVPAQPVGGHTENTATTEIVGDATLIGGSIQPK